MATIRERSAGAAVRRLSLTEFRNYAALRLDLDARPVVVTANASELLLSGRSDDRVWGVA